MRDLRPISQHEFMVARHICKRIQEIQQTRLNYIREHGLDPDLMLPMANWRENAPAQRIHDLYRKVVDPTYDIINNLRLYTQPFTGYPMVPFTLDETKPLASSYTEVIDKMIDEVGAQPHPYVRRYLRIIRNLRKELILKPPRMLGEIGWDIEGDAIDFDIYTYQERINCLFESGIIDWLQKKIQAEGKVNILEIGAGYGGLAYQIKRIIPQTRYLICDLPESLLFSSIYLGLTQSEFTHSIYDGTDSSLISEVDQGFLFVPNFMFGDIAESNIKIDLAINTLSFQEMTSDQVSFYAAGLKHLIGDSGVLYEQSQKLIDPDEFHCDAKGAIAEHLFYKQTIRPVTVAKTTKGTPDIWGNKPITEIIDPSLRPFIGLKFKLYLLVNLLLAIDCNKYVRHCFLLFLGNRMGRRVLQLCRNLLSRH